MKVVALLAQKGGVGKTTLAVSLAVQAEKSGKTAVVLDTDPQSSASGWFLKRKGRGVETPFVGSVTEAERIAQAVADAREEGFDWLFIDTPAGVSAIPAAAAAAADVVLIPCVPSTSNMDAMASTVELVQKLQKPAFFVINRGRSKPINDDCAVALTSGYGLPAVNAHINTRMPIADAELDGSALPELSAKNNTSVSKGQEEFAALWTWLVKQQGGKTR